MANNVSKMSADFLLFCGAASPKCTLADVRWTYRQFDTSSLLIVRCGAATGTAFGLDIDGKQYLVTAKHVLANGPTPLAIDLFSNGNWSGLPVTLVGHAGPDTDISVLATDRRLTPSELPVDLCLLGRCKVKMSSSEAFPTESSENFYSAQAATRCHL